MIDGCRKKRKRRQTRICLSDIGSFEKAKEIFERIKKEIRAKEKITALIDIGPNKLIRKFEKTF